ncbi:MAG: preprotein translocase subunit YajC [Planctomycetaceae bacterium]|jgi:preprotein translocase subunit YajC|nr:preprotein translocase subunit YajC [Planctomycetaceae bacterium]
MHSWLTFTFLLAEETVADPKAPQSPWGGLLPPMIMIAVFYYFMLLRPRAAEERKRKAMLDGLKKNDRVVTAGGIIGTVAQVSTDGKEVTLKVDDSTRIKFRRSSISSVLTDEKDDAAKS